MILEACCDAQKTGEGGGGGGGTLPEGLERIQFRLSYCPGARHPLAPTGTRTVSQ